MQSIKHLIKASTFLEDITPKITEKSHSISSGESVELTFEKDGGYPCPEITIRIDSATPDKFATSWTGSDPTRFPARVKAVATALRDLGMNGVFQVSYKDGKLSIQKDTDNTFSSLTEGSNLKDDIESLFKGEETAVLSIELWGLMPAFEFTGENLD